MERGSKFKDIKSMIKDLSKDEQFKKEALKALEGRELVKYLFTLRCQNGLTQTELAKKIGCGQGRISKIESSYDNEISVKDLLDYGKAFNLQLEIGFRNKSTKIVDLIKYHVLKMRDYLDQLVELVGNDAKLAEGVFNFHLEALYNAQQSIKKNLPRLYKKSIREDIKKRPIHINAPLTEKLEAEKKELAQA